MNIENDMHFFRLANPEQKLIKAYKLYCMLKRCLAQIYLVQRVRRSAYQRGKEVNHRVIRKGVLTGEKVTHLSAYGMIWFKNLIILTLPNLFKPFLTFDLFYSLL